jgi:alcohol dehydrogenase
VVIEPNAQRRAFAQAHGSLAAHPDEAEALVKRVTDQVGADVVIEAVGSNGPLDLAMKLARPRARVVSVGAHAAETWAFPVARAFRDELTVSFAIGDAIRLRRRLLKLVVGGALDPTVVIDTRKSLEDAPMLYRQLAQQQCLKAVITP